MIRLDKYEKLDKNEELLLLNDICINIVYTTIYDIPYVILDPLKYR